MATIEKIEKSFYSLQMDKNTTTGMTHKNTGNFYPGSLFAKAFEAADRALTISDINQPIIGVGYVVMQAEHGNNVWFFEKLNRSESHQIFCDGVIYRGTGAAIFFPGGCPAIAFRDEEVNISGLLHGGWKSVTQNIVKNFFSLWENAGGTKKTTQIVFLPSTCGNCLKYENDGYDYFLKTVYPIIEAMRPNDNGRFIHTIDHSINFNLISLIRKLFTEKGYKKINEMNECVCCSGKYWCYYHDDKNGVKHRNAAFIATPT
ncbi:MAG: laccase domain-containing protein [Patescibacteria group bacterium]